MGNTLAERLKVIQMWMKMGGGSGVSRDGQ